MTRRAFYQIMTGVPVLARASGGNGAPVVLDAVAAPVLPSHLNLDEPTWNALGRPPFVEVRKYRPGRMDQLQRALERRGVHAIPDGDSTLLFAFDTLSIREKTWRELSLTTKGFEIEELAIFRSSQRA